MNNLTSKSVNSDLLFIAKRKGIVNELYFGMDGRDVVMVVNGSETARMRITGDVLGNGMSRSNCESAMFKTLMVGK